MPAEQDIAVPGNATDAGRAESGKRPREWGSTPRAYALRSEREPLARGMWERFGGYGVMALPFASGDLLAFRRFGTSSIGPAYAAIWHRDAEGAWTFYVDVAPAHGCPRYFGEAIDRVVVTEIETTWVGHDHLVVSAPGPRVGWSMRIQPSPATRTLSIFSGLVPTRAWRSDALLGAAGVTAGVGLGVGPLRLAGRAPNGQRFRLWPKRLWRIGASAAQVEGRELGPIGAAGGARLGDLRLPDGGLFACGGGEFEAFEPTLHSDRIGGRVERA